MDIHWGGAMQATLVKWGNSQGIRVPKEACDLLDLAVGARGTMEVDVEGNRIVITFERCHPRPKYRRHGHATLEELAAGWTGGKVGEEWGGADVGAEEVA